MINRRDLTLTGAAAALMAATGVRAQGATPVEGKDFVRLPTPAPVAAPAGKIYYALEATGQLEAMHKRVFAAIHVQRQKLDKEADIAAFVKSAGGDDAKFLDAYKSFGVATKLRQGKQLAEAYKIDGVPTLGIHGRWFTAGSLAGTHERALAVADQLIQRARKPA